MQLYPLKLITIVGEAVSKDKLSRALLELGATGFTMQEVQGSDPSGHAKELFNGPSFRAECICTPEVAEAILTYVCEKFFDRFACIAWVSDVSVVRGSHFVKQTRNMATV